MSTCEEVFKYTYASMYVYVCVCVSLFTTNRRRYVGALSKRKNIPHLSTQTKKP